MIKYCLSITLLFCIFLSAEAQDIQVKYRQVLIPVIEEHGRWRSSASQKRQMMNMMDEKNRNEYSYFMLYSDGTQSFFEHDTTFTLNAKDKNEERNFWFSTSQIYERVRKNYREKSVHRYSPEEIKGQICKEEESLSAGDWVLGKDEKIFAKIACRDAYYITEEGDSIRAWYTRKIPLPDGPGKYSGLPGLILAIEEKQRHFVAEEIIFPEDGKGEISMALNPLQEGSEECLSENDYKDQLRRLISEYYINLQE